MFQQTIKNFGVHFNALNEKNTYSSGDVLSGHATFDLTKETKINEISMEVNGKARIHWSTGGGGSRKRRRHRRHFSAQVEYFNLKSVLVQNSGAIDRAVKLQPGTHVYPFTCRLPQGDFPSTFQGVHGAIEYSLKVGIKRPWHISKDFVTELSFVKHIDINLPELQAPLSGSNQMTVCSLWCTSNPITMAVSIEKKTFLPGETVKITCKFSNGSAQTATPKVKLQQKQEFFTANKTHRRMVIKYLESVTGQPVDAHTSDVHTEIMLTIPSSASLTVSNCSIVNMDYFIEVNLSVFAFPDLTVLCPIILCHSPVHTSPPQYL